MRGRKPKPSALKMFEGNPGKRTLNQNEPRPAVQTPQCPVHLDDEAQAEWNRITPAHKTLGLVVWYLPGGLADSAEVLRSIAAGSGRPSVPD